MCSAAFATSLLSQRLQHQIWTLLRFIGRLWNSLLSLVTTLHKAARDLFCLNLDKKKSRHKQKKEWAICHILLCFWFRHLSKHVAGEQWRRRWRGGGSSSGPWRRSSRHLLCSATSPLSPSDYVPASGLFIPRCLLPAWCQRCLPASVGLQTLPHTLHLLAQGREHHSQT